jgi:hypothetical protein
MIWDGPPLPVEVCRHDPCWCGRQIQPSQFAPWSALAEQMFFADRKLARGELPPTIRTV